MEAWGAIPCAMTEYSFKKCGITNNLDGTDDDIMFEDVCRCARLQSAMPTTRNETQISGMTPPCRYRSSTATTKVVLKDFNYDMTCLILVFEHYGHGCFM